MCDRMAKQEKSEMSFHSNRTTLYRAPTSVLCLSFDAYGRHLAIGTSEPSVKVFCRSVSPTHPYQPVVEFTEHLSAVNDVTWAHTRTGSVLLASCSSDRTIRFYQNASQQSNLPEAWETLSRMRIADLKADAFVHIHFSPKHMIPLKLVACIADGTIRLYEYDVQHEEWFELTRFDPNFINLQQHRQRPWGRATCAAWLSRTTVSHLALVVGSDNGDVTVWRTRSSLSSPTSSFLSSTGTTMCKTPSTVISSSNNVIFELWAEIGVNSQPNKDADDERIDKASTADVSQAHLKPRMQLTSSFRVVRDVQVAPCLGRPYYLIALCNAINVTIVCLYPAGLPPDELGPLLVVPAVILGQAPAYVDRMYNENKNFSDKEQLCSISFDANGGQLVVATSHQRIQIFRREFTLQSGINAATGSTQPQRWFLEDCRCCNTEMELNN